MHICAVAYELSLQPLRILGMDTEESLGTEARPQPFSPHGSYIQLSTNDFPLLSPALLHLTPHLDELSRATELVKALASPLHRIRGTCLL